MRNQKDAHFKFVPPADKRIPPFINCIHTSMISSMMVLLRTACQCTLNFKHHIQLKMGVICSQCRLILIGEVDLWMFCPRCQFAPGRFAPGN